MLKVLPLLLALLSSPSFAADSCQAAPGTLDVNAMSDDMILNVSKAGKLGDCKGTSYNQGEYYTIQIDHMTYYKAGEATFSLEEAAKILRGLYLSGGCF